MKKLKKFEIACSYDTETTTLKISENDYTAFAYLYIFNDLRGVDLRFYDTEQSKISFIRTEESALAYILDLVEWGNSSDVIPVVCAYNLMFDLQTLLYDLRQLFEFEVCAQTATSVYTLDLIDPETGEKMLRFWDTFYLEMRGLAAMGETAGLPKLVGDLDYSLVRTHETNLTEVELSYARRDVEVIPAYLRYLLESNEWLTQDMLGVSVLTKTSLVRQMAKNEIGNKKVKKKNGKRISLAYAYARMCENEQAKTFNQYALRKACFRGGFVFTSAKYAHCLVENVASLDETSAHHAFINGKFVPVNFKKDESGIMIKAACNTILNTAPLKNYAKPFPIAFHACIEFSNIRLKKNSAFEAFEIGLCPQSKFYARLNDIDIDDYRNYDAEQAIRSEGFHDSCVNGVFAYGKLMHAYIARVHVNEAEFYAMSRVYDWDSFTPIYGETTMRFQRPPDYVTLQSMMLFGQKQEIKRIIKNYKEGVPYTGVISEKIDKELAKALRNGTVSINFLKSYYNSTVKGKFNGIYGTQAMDEVRCEYEVSETGELQINHDMSPTAENYAERLSDKSKVLYTYGMRIVGYSRVQLVIAIELLYKTFGKRIQITGGDTDSLKIAFPDEIRNEEIMAALCPLHDATAQSIRWVTQRAHACFPDLSSNLDKVGTFEIEKCGNSDRYPQHMEFWNKARASLDSDNNVHVTFAGVSRPAGYINVETAIEALMLDGVTFENACKYIFGYNTFLDNSISHSMQKQRPKAENVIDMIVTDYAGHACRVNAHKAIALYNCGRLIGDIRKSSNAANLAYQDSMRRKMPDAMKYVYADKNGKIHVEDFLTGESLL